MTPTRFESYLLGYAEGGQAKRSGEWDSSDEEMRGIVTSRRPPEISEQAFAWNLGFARGYRAREAEEEPFIEIFYGLLGNIRRAYRKQDAVLFESSMAALRSDIERLLKIV